MKLTDLKPRWVGAGGPGIYNADMTPAPARHGIGMSFMCPCGKCGGEDWDRVYVSFSNPLDGGPPFETQRPLWTRVGETFEGITLTPSILSVVEKGGCGWHGYVTNGEIIYC